MRQFRKHTGYHYHDLFINRLKQGGTQFYTYRLVCVCMFVNMFVGTDLGEVFSIVFLDLEGYSILRK